MEKHNFSIFRKPPLFTFIAWFFKWNCICFSRCVENIREGHVQEKSADMHILLRMCPLIVQMVWLQFVWTSWREDVKGKCADTFTHQHIFREESELHSSSQYRWVVCSSFLTKKRVSGLKVRTLHLVTGSKYLFLTWLTHNLIKLIIGPKSWVFSFINLSHHPKIIPASGNGTWLLLQHHWSPCACMKHIPYNAKQGHAPMQINLLHNIM